MSRALLLGLLLLVACMEAPKEKRARSGAVTESPRGTAAAALPGPAAGVTTSPPPKPVLPRPAPRRPVQLEQDEPELDPTLVPVEEDFREEVERRIDKRSDLEFELQRVGRGIATRR